MQDITTPDILYWGWLVPSLTTFLGYLVWARLRQCSCQDQHLLLGLFLVTFLSMIWPIGLILLLWSIAESFIYPELYPTPRRREKNDGC
jgi:hypothetical protein